MPLKLDFKHGEKMIVNGAVIENVGSNAQLLVHNKAAILREKEILTQSEAATPASRVYFELQCAYIFRETRDDHLKTFRNHLKDYIDACPSATGIAEDISGNVEKGDLYKGLKSTRALISHEIKTFKNFHDSVGKLVDMAEESDHESGDADATARKQSADA